MSMKTAYFSLSYTFRIVLALADDFYDSMRLPSGDPFIVRAASFLWRAYFVLCSGGACAEVFGVTLV